ncbi:major facilitator superfamily domain-containing protein [Trametes elegans]|nr:major facilitator superfamily domain-containing protein [Trametes elegans]
MASDAIVTHTPSADLTVFPLSESDISSNAAAPPTKAEAATPTAGTSRKGARFWIILACLISATFFGVLEGYAVSTALPTIVSDLHSDQFVWVASAYALSSTALLPLSGGLAEAFGRRQVILGALAIFILGSAISGAAQSMNMLIAGRAVHGAGTGGILTLSQIILSDLVTLQERGTYNGLFGLTWALGGGVGPVVGGALAKHTTWRWLFYLNVPAGGLIAGLLLLCLRQPKHVQTGTTLWETLKGLDWLGNTLIIGASCACAIALTWGGVQFPWQSPSVLVPLCLGVVVFLVWALYEWRFCEHPVVPYHILSNRTSLSGYIQMFIAAFVNIVLIYYLPVYYQACKDASPTASGIDLFGLCFSTGPLSILTGISVARTRTYRPQLWAGWALIVLGRAGVSIAYQVVAGVGLGAIYSAAYFPVLAPLPVSASALALAFFIFLRSFAQIWGVTAGGVLVQNELRARLPASVRAGLPPGLAGANVAYAVIPLVPGLAQPDKDAVRAAFAQALAVLWRVLVGVAGVGLLASVPMRALPLHGVRDEKWAEGEGKGEERERA